jgi:hypothetical protein
MEPEKYRPALDAYCSLLEEAKQRLAALDIMLGGNTGLPAGAIHECGHLQLRMLCELIALGCLVAQGDLEPTGKIKRAYEPGKIMGYLEELHPQFYPHAAAQRQAGPDVYDAIFLTDGFLKKDELVELHGRCGEFLHRGTLQTLFRRRGYDSVHTQIIPWKTKIEALLSYHAIAMLDMKTLVLFVLRNKANNNQVQCVMTESDEFVNLFESTSE